MLSAVLKLGLAPLSTAKGSSASAAYTSHNGFNEHRPAEIFREELKTQTERVENISQTARNRRAMKWAVSRTELWEKNSSDMYVMKEVAICQKRMCSSVLRRRRQ